MSSTPQFAHADAKRPDGCYIQFQKKLIPDDDNPRPDEKDDGFWPSLNPKDAGYVGDNFLCCVSDSEFNQIELAAHYRMRAWERGDWYYVGVRAVALCFIVRNGVGTYVNIESPGIWGVESDSDESYIEELYKEQIAELEEILGALARPTFEK